MSCAFQYPSPNSVVCAGLKNWGVRINAGCRLQGRGSHEVSFRRAVLLSRLRWASCAEAGLATIRGSYPDSIWPGAVPDPQPTSGPEFEETSPKEWQGTGRPVTGISNVTRPTMTVYSPKGNNTGVSVVVFPGGGYQSLAIDLEGTEVCDWLVPRGITCVLLKYRITDVGPYPKSGPYPE